MSTDEVGQTVVEVTFRVAWHPNRYEVEAIVNGGAPIWLGHMRPRSERVAVYRDEERLGLCSNESEGLALLMTKLGQEMLNA